VTIDGVCMGNCINRTLTLVTTNNYDSLNELYYTPKITLSTGQVKSRLVFLSRCLVAASNDGRSPAYGFPELFLVLATNFSQQQLTTSEPQKVFNTESVIHQPTQLHWMNSLHSHPNSYFMTGGSAPKSSSWP
jgi:hypothetical protein